MPPFLPPGPPAPGAGVYPGWLCSTDRADARALVASATGRRSMSYDPSRPGPAQPPSTAASFQARLWASWIPVLEPNAPVGDISWAESPARNTRRSAYRSATRSAACQAALPVISTSRSGTPTARRMCSRTARR